MTERLSDARERRAAVDPSRSFIIQAPAGSGKTELLTQRYLRLLSLVDQPQRILAITFTRKATQEMLDRILQKLRQAQAGQRPREAHEIAAYELAEAVLERDRSMGWNLVGNPAQLQIHTIDGLCARLAAQGGEGGAGLGGLSIADDPGALYQEAARRVVTGLAEENDGSSPALALERLLIRLRGNAGMICDLIVQELARRDQWLGRLGGGLEQLPEVLARRQTEELQFIHAALGQERLARVEELMCSLAAEADDQDSARSLLESIDWARASTDDPGARIAALHDLLNRLAVTGSKPMAGSTAKTRVFKSPDPQRVEWVTELAGVLDEWRADDGASAMFIRFVKNPPLEPSPGDLEFLDWVRALITRAWAELNMLFSETGRCDYAHVAWQAVDALGHDLEPGEALLAEDGRLEHILLDEFQDTSHIQYELLERLLAGWSPGDGRSLFLVGDPMQSIYRFRKADVALFLKTFEARHVGPVALEPLRLRSNFRSRDEILAFVNGHSPRIFRSASPAATGAVAYNEVQGETGTGGEVHLYPNPTVIEPEGEAAQIVEVVRAAIADDPQATIGILGRARKVLAPVAHALQRADIAFEGVEVQPLQHRPVVRELMTLVRALAHPADRIAWLALLTGPWAGLSPTDLLTVAGEEFGEDVLTRLRDERNRAALAADTRQRLERLAGVLENAVGAAARQPLHRRVEAAWLGLNGPCATGGIQDLQDAQSFLDLLAAVESDRPDDLIAALEARLQNLFAGASPSRVQLMTIHKAKGLEFDVVILPGLDAGTGRPGQDLVRQHDFRFDDQLEGTLMAPVKPSGESQPGLYDYLSLLDREDEACEAQRVLYVAMTRARRQLHLFGRFKTRAQGNRPYPPSKSFLAMLWPAFEALIDATAWEEARVESRDTEISGEGLPTLVLAGEPGPVIEAEPAEVESGPIEWHVPDRQATALGEALHLWLELWHNHGWGDWTPESLQDRQAALASSLRMAGASEDRLPELTTVLGTLLRQVLESEAARSLILATGWKDSHAEIAFCEASGDHIRTRILDRLYRDADGNWHIIDYKTGVDASDSRLAWAGQLSDYERLLAASGIEGRIASAVLHICEQGINIVEDFGS